MADSSHDWRLTPKNLAKFTKRFVAMTATHPFYAVALIVAIPFIFIGSQNSWTRTENRVEDWIPPHFSETQKLGRFIQIFGGDEIVMVSWDDCYYDSPELEEYKKALLEPIEIDGRKVQVFRAVITAADLDASLRAEPYLLTDDEIDDRLRGLLLSQDGTKTGLIALISADGAKYRQQTVNYVWAAAEKVPNLGAAKIRVGGSTTDSVSIDQISRTYLYEMNILTYLIGLAILYVTYRNLRVCLLVFSISFLNQQICLATIYYLKIPFDSILMLSVNLAFVLSLSCCIHLANYYRDAIRRLPPKIAVYKMIVYSLVPVAGSIITTIFGLLSLLSSQLTPIRKFGVVSALVLAISVFVIYVCVSIHFLLFPVRSWRGKAETPASIRRRESFGRAIERTFFPLVSRGSGAILVVSVLLFGVGIYGVTKIQTFVGIQKMLKVHTRPVQDYLWLENNFGPLIPVETTLEYPAGDDDALYERLQTLQRLNDRLREEFPDSTILSLLNFIPTLPDESQGSFRATTEATVFRQQIFQNRDLLTDSGYFQEKDGKQYWRTTVRTWTMRDVDYGEFTDRVEKTLDEFFAETNADGAPTERPEILICGGVPLVNRVQSQLIKDLEASFLSAFILIGLVLSVVFRSLKCGALAIFPSLLPCALVFGAVGLSGLKIELGTMLTGSAALGIAVDNTIHFTTWFRFGVRDGLSRSDALIYAYRQCGLPMFQTTAVCVFGLLAYTISPFIPTIYFSLFMGALLTSALLGTYLILPAILIRPTGDLFLRDVVRANALAAPDEPPTPKNVDRKA